MNTHHLNYLILAHRDPELLDNLISAVHDENSSFYIHLDQKTDIRLFQYLEGKYDRLCFITKRESCIWGDFGIVQATLNLIESVKNLDKCGHCLLLSGQDYPIKSRKHIKTFLEQHKHTDFIHCVPAKDAWPNHWKKRLIYSRHNFSEKKGDYMTIPPITDFHFALYLPKILYKVISSGKIKKNTLQIFHLLCKKRNSEFQAENYGGSQWWTLTNRTVARLNTFLSLNPQYATFHRLTHAADEIFFHTVIKHLEGLKASILNNQSTTFTTWSNPPSTSPKTLDSKDVEILLQQDASKLFARKFETPVSSDLINLLNQAINNS